MAKLKFKDENDNFIEAEIVSNKVSSISAASTNAQYPSAKCVYDIVGNIESIIDLVRGVSS